MKKINYLENLRLKSTTSTQIRKIEQKRVETTIYQDDYEDDYIYQDSLIAIDAQNTVQTDCSFNQENLSTTWGKENVSSLIENTDHDNHQFYSNQQFNKPQGHHSRALSANIPYSTLNKAMHTNIKELDKQKEQSQSNSYQQQTQASNYTANNNTNSSLKNIKQPLQSNSTIINHSNIINNNNYNSNNSQNERNSYQKSYSYHQSENNYNTRDSGSYNQWQTEINEEDEDEGENLGENEQDEISLQNFYNDLDRLPLMKRYQNTHENETPLKPTAISRDEKKQGSNQSQPKNLSPEIVEELECSQLQTFEKLNSFIFDELSDYGQTTVIKDQILLTQQLDSLEISLQCGEDKDNLLSSTRQLEGLFSYDDLDDHNYQNENELVARNEVIDELYQSQYCQMEDPLQAQQRYQVQVLEQMILRQEEYFLSSKYMQRQRNISQKMREILIDWMMEVCEEFMLKRETLYISINFIDRYLQEVTYVVPKNELQLIGVTSMFIACKIEEVYIPRVNDFALSTDGGYSKDQILNMESQLMKVLQFKLHPITICNWTNWYMNMWDIYQDERLKCYYQNADFTFKQPNELAYQRYRIVFQILDSIMLTPQTLDFDPRCLVASVLYLMIGGPHMMGAFNYDYKWFPSQFERFPPFDMSRGKKRYQPISEQTQFYNQVFEGYLYECFGLQLQDLVESINYVIYYFALPLTFDLPSAAANNQDSMITISEVSRFIINKSYGNLDQLKISRELENEGIEISKEKLSGIIKALKNFLFKILKAAQLHQDNHIQIIQTVQQTLADRTALREKMIAAITTALQTEFQLLKEYQDTNNLKTFFEQIKLRHLVSFDCTLNHDFSSAESKNLKKTYATLIFQISEVDGQVKTRSIEVNLEELKQFKEEIIRIEEALS